MCLAAESRVPAAAAGQYSHLKVSTGIFLHSSSLHAIRVFLLRPVTIAKYCNEYVRLSVCLFVCLSARVTRKPRSRTLPNFFERVACGSGSVLP